MPVVATDLDTPAVTIDLDIMENNIRRVQAHLSRLGVAIVIEAALGFLGVGVPPPTPTWGNMLADSITALVPPWWLAFFPGLAITVTVLAFNLLGDGIRDTLDPRLSPAVLRLVTGAGRSRGAS